MKIVSGCKICSKKKPIDIKLEIIGNYDKWFSDKKFSNNSVVGICKHKKVCILN